ncbi:MAG: type II toxin-antitoxin system PemK/MazF family toxin [Planctomycetota bacterium]
MRRPRRELHRGEVRWYKFAAPDKARPVLILTRDSALRFLGEATVAPITTTIRAIPSEVALRPADGLPRACAVNLDHVQTIAIGKLGRRITALPAQRMAEVRAALLFALGLEA